MLGVEGGSTSIRVLNTLSVGRGGVVRRMLRVEGGGASVGSGLSIVALSIAALSIASLRGIAGVISFAGHGEGESLCYEKKRVEMSGAEGDVESGGHQQGATRVNHNEGKSGLPKEEEES